MSIRHIILAAKAGFFYSSAGKIESVSEFKKTFATSCFIAGDGHLKVTSLHTIVFS